MIRLKDLLLRLTLSFFRERWKSESSFKVLIQVTPVFTQEKWIKLISSNLNLNQLDQVEIVFTKSRFGYLKNFIHSNYCFQFGSGKRLKLYGGKDIYYPLRGQDGLNQEFKVNNRILSPKLDLVNKAIAEYCLGMAIISGRNLHLIMNSSQNKEWNQKPAITKGYQELSKQKIGVLGYGAVGKEVIGMFEQNGVKVACCSKSRELQIKTNLEYYSIDQLEQFLSTIDILIIAVSLNNQTRGMFSRPILDKLNARLLINVSRGEVFLESDLQNWLQDNPEALAILDVFSLEPLPRSSKFYSLQNCIVTPHVAGNIGLFRENIILDFLDKLKDLLEKKPC